MMKSFEYVSFCLLGDLLFFLAQMLDVFLMRGLMGSNVASGNHFTVPHNIVQHMNQTQLG